MGEQQPIVITKGTLVSVSLGVVLAMTTAIGVLATDRADALSSIRRNKEEVVTLKAKVDYLASAMMRIEVKLGTRPLTTEPAR